MIKNFIWGVAIFLLNIFMLFLNYSKNFSFPVNFFVESNQLMAFLVGLAYAQQCRKFDVKHILGVVCNSMVFSVLITLLFGIYEAPVSFVFTIMLGVAIFVYMFASYALFYWLFCPDKYKRKHIKKKRKV